MSGGHDRNIRAAEISDLDGINALLYQVAMVHYNGRPDLFRAGAKKYTDEELCVLIEQQRETRPIFVYADDVGNILGYAFCMVIDYADEHVLTPIKSLYIDDLCVEEHCRGMHIGTALYAHVCAYAKEIGCYNVTLNVWARNEGARKFYEKCGMQVQKLGMETIL